MVAGIALKEGAGCCAAYHCGRKSWDCQVARMRYLNSLYVRNHQARVQHRSGSLLISSPEGKQKIPLEGVDALVLMGSAQITTQTLDACVQRGVRMSALKKSGSVRFTVNGTIGGNVH